MRCAIVSLTGPLAEGMGEVKGGREVMHRRQKVRNSYVQSYSLFTEIKLVRQETSSDFKVSTAHLAPEGCVQTRLLIVSVLIFRKSLYDTDEKEI